MCTYELRSYDLSLISLTHIQIVFVSLEFFRLCGKADIFAANIRQTFEKSRLEGVDV